MIYKDTNVINFKAVSLLSLIILSNLYAELSNDIIGKAITKLSPTIDGIYCSKISEIINKYSKLYEVDWKIAVAIFRKESEFNYKAVNYPSRDFGIGQINSFNMKAFKFDLGRQMTDVDYAIHNTFKMLNGLKKYNTCSSGHLQWFTRYHSFTEKWRKNYYYGSNGLETFLKELNYGKTKCRK